MITALPEAGKLSGQRLWLALLSDQNLIKEPTTASAAAIVTNSHSAHCAQGHRLDEKLVMLQEEREETG